MTDGCTPAAAQSRTSAAPGVPEIVEQVRQVAEQTAIIVKPLLRGVLHQVAFVLSLATGTVIVIRADGPRATVAATVYAMAVALLFATSAAYHRRSWSTRAHDVMRRLDHSMIYVLIAGTYTPIALLVLDGAFRWVILGIVWGGALAGVVTLNAVSTERRWLFTALYLALGWVALTVLPALLTRAGVVVLVLVLAGGLFYTAGAIVYVRRRPDPAPAWFGFHEVFHALTLLAFVVHYIAVSLVTYSPPV